jgi:NTP pyrophosphatase (non-canonical NTP hydrolase)
MEFTLVGLVVVVVAIALVGYWLGISKSRIITEHVGPISMLDLQRVCFRAAKSKGFYMMDGETVVPGRRPTNEDVILEQFCCAMHDEVSELHEAWRNGVLYAMADKKGLELSNLEEEMADMLIRLCCAAEIFGVHLGDASATKISWNAGRQYRHGDKLA